VRPAAELVDLEIVLGSQKAAESAWREFYELALSEDDSEMLSHATKLGRKLEGERSRHE